MLSSSLNYHSLKAMLLRSTTLTAGMDFLRQGREVGGFCSQTQSASFLLGFVDGKRLRRFCRTSPVERHTGQRTFHLKESCRCAHVRTKALQALSSFPFHAIRCDLRPQGMAFHYNFGTACTARRNKCLAATIRLHFL